MKKRKRVNPFNRERSKKKHGRNFGEYAVWIRMQPCIVCGTRTQIQAAHMKSRGMGGCGGDKRHLLPLCYLCHHDETINGRGWLESETGLDLRLECKKYRIRYEQEATGGR